MVKFVKPSTLVATGVGRRRRRGEWDFNTLIILVMGEVDMMGKMVGSYYGEHTSSLAIGSGLIGPTRV